MNRRVAISTTLSILVIVLCLIVWIPRTAPRRESLERPVAPRPVAAAGREDPGARVSTKPPPPQRTADAPAAALGAVSGRVLAARTLVPIAEATVQLRPDVPGRLEGPRDSGLLTRTDADGGFRFEGAAEGLYRVLASAPERLDAAASGVIPGEPVTLLLERDPGTPGRVLLAGEDGPQPLPWTPVAFALADGSWTFETQSDAYGGLRIHGLAADALDQALAEGAVHASVPGYASAHVVSSSELEGLDPGSAHATVVVEGGRTVLGRTIDAESGLPVAAATVLADSGHGTTTASDGTFELRGVEEGLTAYAGGYAPSYHAIDGEAGADEGPARIALQRGVDLAGIVRGKDGRPLEGTRIRVHTDRPETSATPGWALAPLRELWSTTADASGAYRIAGLGAPVLELPGAVDLEVSLVHWEGTIVEEVGAPVGHGEARHDLTLDIGSLQGRVLRHDGDPVVAATVVAATAEDRVRVAVGTDSTGAFQAPRIPAGSVSLAVYVDGNVAGTADASVPGPPVDIRIGEGYPLAGTVLLDRFKVPLSGFSVRLLAEADASTALRSTRTSEWGEFALESVPQGRYLLEIRAEPGALPFDAWLPEHREPVEIRGGAEELLISYPSHPSAPVNLRFLLRGESGSLLPLESPVELRVTRYARGGFQVGRLRDASGQPRRWSATGSLQTRFREGRYTFRCRADVDGQPLTRDETVEVSDGEPVSRDIVFDLRR